MNMRIWPANSTSSNSRTSLTTGHTRTTAVTMGSDLKFHPSWTDFRGNPGISPPNQEAYTQAIQLH